MLVFIDESGDPGFRINKGSSKYFVIVLIIFDDDIEAENTAKKIKNLKINLGKSEKFEFKFNKCKKEIRLSFLKSIQNCKFRIRAIIFDKEKIYSDHLRNSKDSFYNFALAQLLKNNGNNILNARIKIDGSGDKKFRQNLENYLKKKINLEGKIISNLRFCDSEKNLLIQLSDMIAGSIRRHYENQDNDCEEYRKIIKKREENIWEFR